MGKVTLLFGFIIALVFIYLLVTNQAFMGFALSAVKGYQATQPQLNSSILQLLNITKAMNESQFLGWAEVGGGVANPLIGGIRAITNSSTFEPYLKELWSTLQNYRNGGTPAQISAAVNSIINSRR